MKDKREVLFIFCCIFTVLGALVLTSCVMDFKENRVYHYGNAGVGSFLLVLGVIGIIELVE